MKIFISTIITVVWTRIEFLLGLKLSNHTGTFTEASNFLVELYETDEIQKVPNEQQYRSVLDNF